MKTNGSYEYKHGVWTFCEIPCNWLAFKSVIISMFIARCRRFPLQRHIRPQRCAPNVRPQKSHDFQPDQQGNPFDLSDERQGDRWRMRVSPRVSPHTSPHAHSPGASPPRLPRLWREPQRNQLPWTLQVGVGDHLYLHVLSAHCSNIGFLFSGCKVTQ